jgi:hypothetical protein
MNLRCNVCEHLVRQCVCVAALPHLRVQETAASELANTAGLHGKYLVQKVRDPDGKHAECRYFVLDPQHDLAAADAIRFYASLVQASRRDLYDDLVAWLGSPAPDPRPVVDRVAIAQTLKDHGVLLFAPEPHCQCGHVYERLHLGGVSWEDQALHRADAVLALLPTEEGEGS